MMRLWLCLTVLVVGLTIWWSRAVFILPFDLPYLQELFGQSQWRIPQSARIIGDNDLYQVAGYAMVKDGSYFDINPEVPPIGKLVYGAAAIWFGNPYWGSLVMYVATLAAMYWLSSLVLKEKTPRALAMGLTAASPLFAAQLGQTMLDLPQLLSLLIHVSTLIKAASATSSARQVLWYELAGLSLGAFIGTKIAIYAPLLLLVDAWWLWRRQQLTWGLLVLTSAGLTYAVTYLPYLLQNGPLTWLKSQKWMLEFYRTGQVSHLPLMAIITTFTGWFKGWWTNATWIKVSEWSITWALAVVATVPQLRQDWVARHFSADTRTYLRLLVLGLLFLNAVLPFWPRYFLLMLPFGCLLLAEQLNIRPRLAIVILALTIGQFVAHFRQGPEGVLSLAADSWNKGNYQDLYTFFGTPMKQNYSSRQDFVNEAQQETSYHQTRLVFQPINTPVWENKVVVPFEYRDAITNQTRYTGKATLIREHNQWKFATNELEQ